MYGVPPDLPLQHFVGKQCNQIAVGKLDIQFHFDGRSINVRGGWAFHDASGARVDGAQEHGGRDAYYVHKLLDSPVERYLVEAPSSFTLFFENGFALTIFDDDEHYESFTLRDGPNLFVV